VFPHSVVVSTPDSQSGGTAGSIPGGALHRVYYMLGAHQACHPFGVG
jgi:hypothetical protein